VVGGEAADCGEVGKGKVAVKVLADVVEDAVDAVVMMIGTPDHREEPNVSGTTPREGYYFESLRARQISTRRPVSITDHPCPWVFRRILTARRVFSCCQYATNLSSLKREF